MTNWWETPDARWQQGDCLDYAVALRKLDPSLRFGTAGYTELGGGDASEGWRPAHHFAHDDTHYYDSLGKHPLSFLSEPSTDHHKGLRSAYDHIELDGDENDWGEHGQDWDDESLTAAADHVDRHGILKTAEAKTYWRAHPDERPFSVDDAHSREWGYPESERDEGYSAFERPEDLFGYFHPSERQSWNGSHVVEFTGHKVGTGMDSESLVVPDMNTVNHHHWNDVENMVGKDRVADINDRNGWSDWSPMNHEAAFNPTKTHLPWVDVGGLTPEQSAFQRTHPKIRQQILDGMRGGNYQQWQDYAKLHYAQSRLDFMRASEGRPSPYAHPKMPQPYGNPSPAPMNTTVQMRAVAAAEEYSVHPDELGFLKARDYYDTPLSERPWEHSSNAEDFDARVREIMDTAQHEGIREPVDVWGDRMHDGAHRWEAARRLGIELPLRRHGSVEDDEEQPDLSSDEPHQNDTYGFRAGGWEFTGHAPDSQFEEEDEPPYWTYRKVHTEPGRRGVESHAEWTRMGHNEGKPVNQWVMTTFHPDRPDHLISEPIQQKPGNAAEMADDIAHYQANDLGYKKFEDSETPRGTEESYAHEWPGHGRANVNRRYLGPNQRGSLHGLLETLRQGPSSSSTLHGGETDADLFDPKHPLGWGDAGWLKPEDPMRRLNSAIPNETDFKAAGIAVIAMDTGRVLMQQRSLNPILCPCGRGVTWDEQNGWQHDDGSVDHEEDEFYGQTPSDLLDQGHGIEKEAMPRDENFLNDLDYQYSLEGEPGGQQWHSIQAVDGGGAFVGHINWHPETGIIDYVNTEDHYQRRGLATELLNRARTMAFRNPHIVTPEHDPRHISPEAYGWITKGLGEEVSPYVKKMYSSVYDGMPSYSVDEAMLGMDVDDIVGRKPHPESEPQTPHKPTEEELAGLSKYERMVAENDYRWRMKDLGKEAALEHDPNEGTWEFPGGKIDPGETPRAAAVREFREEVGQDLPPGVFVGAWLSPGGIVVAAGVNKVAVQPGDQTYGYGSGHTAPVHSEGMRDTLDNMDDMMPDYLEHPDWYGNGGGDAEAEAHSKALVARGNPDKKVWVYRAVPHGVSKIYGRDEMSRMLPEHDPNNLSEWVTTSKTYAKEHAQAERCPKCGGNLQVISGRVRAGDLANEGYPTEFGYHGAETIDHAGTNRIYKGKCPAPRRVPKTNEQLEAEYDQVKHLGLEAVEAWEKENEADRMARLRPRRRRQSSAEPGFAELGWKPGGHEGEWWMDDPQTGTRHSAEKDGEEWYLTSTAPEGWEALPWQTHMSQPEVASRVQDDLQYRESTHMTPAETHAQAKINQASFGNMGEYAPKKLGRPRRGIDPEHTIHEYVPDPDHDPMKRLNQYLAASVEPPAEHVQKLLETGWTPRHESKPDIHPDFTKYSPTTGVHHQISWARDTGDAWMYDASVPDESMMGRRTINRGHPDRVFEGKGSIPLADPDAVNSTAKKFERDYFMGSKHGEPGIEKHFYGEPEPQWQRSEPAFERSRTNEPESNPVPFVGDEHRYMDYRVPAVGDTWVEGYHNVDLDEPPHSRVEWGHQKLNAVPRVFCSECDVPVEDGRCTRCKREVHVPKWLQNRPVQTGYPIIREDPVNLPELGQSSQDDEFLKDNGIDRIAARKSPVYKGFIYLIQHERDIDLGNREHANPDDPDGDMTEQSAWWDIEHARKNPALRKECKSIPWSELELWADKSVRTNKQVMASLQRLASVSDEYGYLFDEGDDDEDFDEESENYTQGELIPKPFHYYHPKSGRPMSEDAEKDFASQKARVESSVAQLKQMHAESPDSAPSPMIREQQLKLLGPEWKYAKGPGGYIKSAVKNVDGLSHHVTVRDPIWRGGPDNHEAVYHHLIMHPTGEVAKRYVSDIGRVFDVAEGNHPVTDDSAEWPQNSGGGWGRSRQPIVRAPFQVDEHLGARGRRADRREDLLENDKFDPERHTSFPDAQGYDNRRTPQWQILRDSTREPKGFRAGSISGRVLPNGDYEWSHYRLPIGTATKDPKTGHRSITMASEGRDWSGTGGWGPSTRSVTYNLYAHLKQGGHHVKWDDEVLPSDKDHKEFEKAGFKLEGGDYVKTDEGKKGNIVHHRIYPLGGSSGGQYGVQTYVNGLPRTVRQQHKPGMWGAKVKVPPPTTAGEAIKESKRRHRKYGSFEPEDVKAYNPEEVIKGMSTEDRVRPGDPSKGENWWEYEPVRKEAAGKCSYCKSPSTKEIKHSEGMGLIAVCDKHLTKGKENAAASVPFGKPDPDNINSIKAVAGQSWYDPKLPDPRPKLPEGLVYYDSPHEPYQDFKEDDGTSTKFWRYHDSQLDRPYDTAHEPGYHIGENERHNRSVDWQPMAILKDQSDYATPEAFDRGLSRTKTNVKWDEPICENCYLRYGNTVPETGHGWAVKKYMEELDEPHHDFKPMVPDTDEAGRLKESSVKESTVSPSQKVFPMLRELVSAGKPEYSIRHGLNIPAEQHDRIIGGYPQFHDEKTFVPQSQQMYALKSGKGYHHTFLAPVVHNETGELGWLRGNTKDDPKEWCYYPEEHFERAVTGRDLPKERKPRGGDVYRGGRVPQEGDVPLDDEGHQLHIEPGYLSEYMTDEESYPAKHRKNGSEEDKPWWVYA